MRSPLSNFDVGIRCFCLASAFHTRTHRMSEKGSQSHARGDYEPERAPEQATKSTAPSRPSLSRFPTLDELAHAFSHKIRRCRSDPSLRSSAAVAPVSSTVQLSRDKWARHVREHEVSRCDTPNERCDHAAGRDGASATTYTASAHPEQASCSRCNDIVSARLASSSLKGATTGKSVTCPRVEKPHACPDFDSQSCG